MSGDLDDEKSRHSQADGTPIPTVAQCRHRLAPHPSRDRVLKPLYSTHVFPVTLNI